MERSAIAEAVTRAIAEEDGYAGLRVSSAGISVRKPGTPMTGQARDSLEANGYETRPHQARQLEIELLNKTDLVLCMTQREAAAVMHMVGNHHKNEKPAYIPEIGILPVFAGYKEEVGNPNNKVRKIHPLLRGPVYAAFGFFDLEDPRRVQEVYNDLTACIIDYAESTLERLLREGRITKQAITKQASYIVTP